MRPIKKLPICCSGAARDPRNSRRARQKTLQEQAQFLSGINLSSGTQWKYPFRVLPRPRGEATKVIYTEYDLPRPESEPHDTAVDPDGMVWYSDFGSLYLGRLDPRTGETKEWRISRGEAWSDPHRQFVSLVRQRWQRMGRAAAFTQATVYKFDKKTENFSSWSAPKQYNNSDSRTSMTAPLNSGVDGKVWFGQRLGE